MALGAMFLASQLNVTMRFGSSAKAEDTTHRNARTTAEKRRIVDSGCRCNGYEIGITAVNNDRYCMTNSSPPATRVRPESRIDAVFRRQSRSLPDRRHQSPSTHDCVSVSVN